MAKSKKSQFEQSVERDADQGLIGEFIAFLKTNKKWWLTPVLVMFLIFGLLLVLAGTGLAPYIYSLF